MLSEFIQKYYLPPVGVEPENRVFSAPHLIISSILFIIIFCIFYSVIKRKSQTYSNKVLVTSAVLMLLLEIFRISWNSYYHGFSITNFRFDFCNQICMVLPFIVFLQDKRVYPYIELLAIIGGFLVLVYPLWVFYDYAGFHLLALQSLVSHGLMLLTGLVMPFASGRIPKAREGCRDTMLGFCVILIIAFIASNFTGVNYLLMKGAHGVPILQSIPFPFYWIPFLLAAFGAFYLLSLAFHDFICYVTQIPLNSTHLYGEPLGSVENRMQQRFLKFKYTKPLEYQKFIRRYQG